MGAMSLLLLIYTLTVLQIGPGKGQSLARQKHVTMSSEKYGPGSRAVDGNYDRNLENCASTQTETDPWLEIDFGYINTFTRIVVYGRTFPDQQYQKQNLAGLELHLDDVMSASVPNNEGNFINFHHFNLNRAYSKRYVKFVLKGNNERLVLCEIDVYNDSNISRGKTALASSQYSTWKASLAVDGLIQTGDPDNCNCCAGTANQKDPWLLVDLGDTFLVTYIRLHGRTDVTPPGQSFDGMKIEIDNTSVTRHFMNKYEIFPIPEKIGRNIKFTLVGEDRLLVMCEVEIYGERVISTGKKAWISSLFTNWVAERAVDGDYRTDAGQCDCCTATGYEKDPVLRVDIGQSHVVTGFAIYGRTDGYYTGQNFTGMTIQLDGELVQTIPTSAEWINFYTFQLGPAKSGGNVTLTLLGQNKQLVVCELMVYGDCVDGFFGEICTSECHCMGEPCHTLSGICPSGICAAGYRGNTCSDICDAGDYGLNCSLKCGHCKKEETCDHVTGHCTECMAGYINTDPFCNTECSAGSHGYNCSDTCGSCLNSEPCNVTTGICSDCADGFKHADMLCKTVCDNGTFGRNCTDKCGNCRNNEVCNNVNGSCTECMDGYTETDLTCRTNCQPGRYGQKCLETCGTCNNSMPCFPETGFCNDCMDGFLLLDQRCKTACPRDSYGYNCTERCGNCRDDVTCRHTDGVCEQCENGYNYTDRVCKTVCNPGSFGFNCLETCGYCTVNEICHFMNGTCSSCAEGYVGTTCTERLQQEDSSVTGIIIGVVVVAVLVVVAVITGVIIVMRRKRQLPKEPANHSANSKREYANIAFDDGTKHEINMAGNADPAMRTEDDSNYYNFTPANLGIQIHRLWDYIRTNKDTQDGGFTAEFKKIKDGLLYPYNDALANRGKTRYREMFPYDHSRVHLSVERDGETDFINASHIDGYTEKRKFIASQGPIDAMVADFWRMVWQQNSSKIVMLTNLVEAGSHKCMQYWPESGTCTFERITIELIKDKNLSDYNVRTLEVKQDGENPRRIRQYHYKAWPDKDVPDSTWSLVQFWREVFKDRDKDTHPVVVHCSAGVGRTGTFIALDNLYHQAVSTGCITPYTVVEKLRQQRVKMVQTCNQYKYLHEAIADSLLFGTHFLWQSQFPNYYDFMNKTDKPTGKVRLKLQYELVQKSIDGTDTADPEKAVPTSSTNKEIDEYRPVTMPNSGTGALKVVYLPGLDGKKSYVLTGYMERNAIEESWKLIDDNNIKTVITFGDEKMSMKTMWSAMDQQSCANYSPQLIASKQIGDVTERTFTYSRRTKTQTKSTQNQANVKQVELVITSSIVDLDSEDQAMSILTLLDLVTNTNPHISSKEPVLIQCRDGITNSGVVAVLLNEKLRIIRDGGQINILESVMTMKRSRRSCIASYSQYKYIHDMILHTVAKKNQHPVHEVVDNEDTNIYQNV